MSGRWLPWVALVLLISTVSSTENPEHSEPSFMKQTGVTWEQHHLRGLRVVTDTSPASSDQIAVAPGVSEIDQLSKQARALDEYMGITNPAVMTTLGKGVVMPFEGPDQLVSALSHVESPTNRKLNAIATENPLLNHDTKVKFAVDEADELTKQQRRLDEYMGAPVPEKDGDSECTYRCSKTSRSHGFGSPKLREPRPERTKGSIRESKANTIATVETYRDEAVTLGVDEADRRNKQTRALDEYMGVSAPQKVVSPTKHAEKPLEDALGNPLEDESKHGNTDDDTRDSTKAFERKAVESAAAAAETYHDEAVTLGVDEADRLNKQTRALDEYMGVSAPQKVVSPTKHAEKPLENNRQEMADTLKRDSTPVPTLGQLTPTATSYLLTPEPAPQPNPTSTAVTTPAYETTPSPTQTPASTPESTPELTLALTPTPTPEPIPEPTPDSTPELTPVLTPTPTATPEPTPQPTSTSELTPPLTSGSTPEPTSEPTPERTTTPEPMGELTPTPTPELVPTPQSTLKSTPESIPEPTPATTPYPYSTEQDTEMPTPAFTTIQPETETPVSTPSVTTSEEDTETVPSSDDEATKNPSPAATNEGTESTEPGASIDTETANSTATTSAGVTTSNRATSTGDSYSPPASDTTGGTTTGASTNGSGSANTTSEGNNSTSTESSSGLGAGAIAGIVVGCAALLAVIVGALLFRQRSIARQREANMFAELSDNGGAALETDYAAM